MADFKKTAGYMRKKYAGPPKKGHEEKVSLCARKIKIESCDFLLENLYALDAKGRQSIKLTQRLFQARKKYLPVLCHLPRSCRETWRQY
ncbi:hypothetical protein SAMN05216404_103175 [Nitrosospira multiformis]|uniref:Uncharacterized protein n=1 Tax=Nitrosospira multiformis TaxID=1231 RepID=A0A1H8EWY2_9PROT|nr:hypothetical protein SAMN05216404_103175 [Nitrosospira multiformis]